MSQEALYYGDMINRADPLNRGLVSRWQVVPWYASGPRFIDLCGRNHGTLTNGPTWTGPNGRPNDTGAVSFDGTDDYVFGPLASSLSADLTANHTLALWVKARTANDGTDTAFGFSVAGGATIWEVIIEDAEMGGGISYRMRDEDNRWAWRYCSQAVNDNVWHYLVFTKSGNAAGNLGIYVDGVPATGQNNYLSTGFATPNEANPVAIGASWLPGSSAAGGFFTGEIDDVRFFGRDLSAAEVSALYLESLQGSPRTLRRVAGLVEGFDAGGAAAVSPRLLALLGVGM